MTATVSIIDDDPSVLDAIAMLLRMQGHSPASYSTARAFLDAPFVPGCIVSDVRMPEMTGLDLMRELKSKDDPRPILLLTGHGDIEMAVQAIKLGAFDFIEKPFSDDRLLDSIEKALRAATSSLEVKLQLADLKERYQSLTDRQRDTMQLLIRGLANKEIGLRLGISPRTVEIHRTWVMNKMSAKTLTDLVRMGMTLGLD